MSPHQWSGCCVQRPGNIGELTLTLTSEVNKQTSVFAPNADSDQNMTPSAFPSSYFTYRTRRDECRSA